MDDLVILLLPQCPVNLGCLESFNLVQRDRGKIHQSLCELFPLPVGTSDRIAWVKISGDSDDPRREQAFAPTHERLHGALIEGHLTFGAQGKRDPMFSAGQPTVAR